jgi:hypothetical protein
MLGHTPEHPVRLLIRLFCLACTTLLSAQVAGTALSPSAQLFDRMLREVKGGLLVVLDGPKGEWKAKVDVLSADPEWVDLDLPLRYYGAKAGEIEGLLRQQFQVGPRPQWVLVGPERRLVASGTTAPEAKALARAVEEGGVRSTLQVLRDFARRNPDHLGGREFLCLTLNHKASRKTNARIGAPIEPVIPQGERFDYAKFQKERDENEEAKAREGTEEKALTLLKPEEDQAIWGELAELLTKSFRDGDWLEMEHWTLRPDEAATHSPLMQTFARAAVPEVERALGRNPASWRLWDVWLGLSRTFGGKPIRPLLDSLVPPPDQSPESWPPYSVREAYVKDARARKDWQGIRDLLLPQIEASQLWEAIQGRMTVERKVDGKVQADPVTGDAWRSTIEPLAEALLRLGEVDRADQLVRDQFSRHPWSGLPARAAALASRCGQTNLAAQWAGLGPGK